MKYLKLYNESLTDKMSPKSEEEIIANAKKMNPVTFYKKISSGELDFDIPIESQPLIFQIYQEFSKKQLQK